MSWNISTQVPKFDTQTPRPDTYDQTTEVVREVPITGKLRNFSGDYVNVTLRGRVGTDPDITTTTHGRAAARFRLAVTRRGRDDAGVWHDVDTIWYTVKAWNGLAQNVGFSVRKGQPVMVQGRLSVNQWEKAETNSRGVELVITANSIGHDLTAGVSQFMRPMRSSRHPTASTANADIEPAANISDCEAEASAAVEDDYAFDAAQPPAESSPADFDNEDDVADSLAGPAF